MLVTGLEQQPGGWRVQTSHGPLAAAAVVLGLPTTTTARLLAGPVPDAGTALAGVEVASVAVVALAVHGLEAETSGLLVPPVEARAAGVAVKAVTFSGTKWEWVAGPSGAGRGVLRASLGRAGEESVLQRDDAALADLVRRDLTTLLGEGHRSALAAGAGGRGALGRRAAAVRPRPPGPRRPPACGRRPRGRPGRDRGVPRRRGRPRLRALGPGGGGPAAVDLTRRQESGARGRVSGRRRGRM